MGYTWLIDAGHGGFKDGKYVTAPGKMVEYEDGFTIYEGGVNRSVVKFLVPILEKYGVNFALIYDEIEDVPLHRRISLANKLQFKYGNCIVVSIHSNAGKGAGFEVFTKPGQDSSDVIAELLVKQYLEDYPAFCVRSDKSDGDLDKEANFAMVGGNKKYPLDCPSVLVENLFMDNRKEAELLVTEAFQQRLAGTIARWILKVEQNKPI